MRKGTGIRCGPSEADMLRQSFPPVVAARDKADLAKLYKFLAQNFSSYSVHTFDSIIDVGIVGQTQKLVS